VRRLERYIETNKEIQIFKSEVLLHRLKKTGNLPWQEMHRLDVVPVQHRADAIEGCADTRRTVT
jgi:hypothetical protein